MKKSAKNADLLILFITLLLTALISSATTLYGDDFIYGTYFCGSIGAFFKKTAEHYMQMNGRAFIHFLLELVLIFKDRLFFAVIPMMMIFVFYMFRKLTNNGNTKRTALYYSLCFCGIMLIPVKIVREGILWMSGAFNYLFPVGMSLLGFFILKKSYEIKSLPFYFYPAALLSGATTEQCGMIAIGSAFFYIVYKEIKRHTINKNAVILTVCMIIGYITVILSPGTSSRISDETVTAGMNISDRLGTLFYTVLLNKGVLLIFIPCIVIYAFNLKSKNFKLFLSTLILCAAASVFTFAQSYLPGGIFLTASIIVTAAGLLIYSDSAEIPILMLAAAGSMGMLVFSDSYGYRNFLPALLIFICLFAVELSLSLDIHGTDRKNIYLAVYFVISLSVFFPTLKGYCKNRAIINENILRLSSGGNEIDYNVDIDKLYGYNQYFVDSFYYNGIKEIYGLDKGDKIYMFGVDFEPFFINGVHVENPIYKKDGELYYPLRGLAEALGGSCGWDNDKKCAVFTLGEKTVYFDSASGTLSDGTTEYPSEYILKDNKYGNFFRSNTYIKENGVYDIFGIVPQQMK